MRLRICLALLVAVLAMVFVPAGAVECNDGPVICTVKWGTWASTHPGQALNTDNWHQECLIVCFRVPRPLG